MWSEDGEVILEVTKWFSTNECPPEDVELVSFPLPYPLCAPTGLSKLFLLHRLFGSLLVFQKNVKRKRPCPFSVQTSMWLKFNACLGFQSLLQWFLFPAAGRNPKRPLFPLVFAKVSCNSSAVQTFHHLTPFWPLLSGFAGTMRGKSRRFCSCKTRRSCTGWTSTTPSPSGRWARWSTPIKRCRLFHPISCSVAQ